MKKYAAIPVAIIILAAGWYLGSPLFIDEVVDEEFPVVAPEASDDKMMEADDEAAMDDAKMMEMLENLTEEDVAAMPEEKRMEMQKEMEEMGKKMPDTVVEEAMMEEEQDQETATGPELLVSGQFRDGDALHKGSGDAKVYQLEDGSHLVRFENFSVTNGPALSVFLVKSADGDKASGSVNLGKLKGNKGSQNYTIPADIDPNDYSSVLIYCVPFKVPFAVAPLS